MNIATMVFLQAASDINSELLNNPKLKKYKVYAMEIQYNIKDINKVVHRIEGNKYDKIICRIADQMNEYLEQANNLLQRTFVAKIQYNKLKEAVQIMQLGAMVDFAKALYSLDKDQKLKSDFIMLESSVKKFANKFDCMLNDTDEVLNVNVADCIYEPMIKSVQKMISESIIINKN